MSTNTGQTVAELDHLSWHGYTVRCAQPSCATAEGPWTLHVRRAEGMAGEDAWAACPHGHRTFHPLVHPALVHWVATHAAPPPPHNWLPHLRIVHDYGSRLPDGLDSSLEWRPWGPPGPPRRSGPARPAEWWRRHWPGLLEAGHHLWPAQP